MTTKKEKSPKGRDKKDPGQQRPEGGSSENRGLANVPIPGRKPAPPLDLNLNPLDQAGRPDPREGQFGPVSRRGGSPGDGDERDPTRTTGIGFLDAADAFLQQPQTPQDVTTPTERPGNRELADRSRQLLRPVRPPEEEEPPILPGNPDDLGARGRRRRREDDDTPSPVLRRGLLGV